MYGIDEHGKLYIHMRIFKAQRIFGEMMVTDGTVLIHCRECLRWHKVKIVQPDTATLEETEPPVQVAN